MAYNAFLRASPFDTNGLSDYAVREMCSMLDRELEQVFEKLFFLDLDEDVLNERELPEDPSIEERSREEYYYPEKIFTDDDLEQLIREEREYDRVIRSQCYGQPCPKHGAGCTVDWAAAARRVEER